MIVVLGGQKGGVGKTTIAVHAACELAARGRRVTLFDADDQGSALTYGSVAERNQRAVVDVRSPRGDVYEAIRGLAPSVDDIVVDTPGRLDDVQCAAMMAADVVVLPVVPSALDAWSLAATLNLLTKARTARPDLLAALLVNMRDGRTADGQEARADLLTDEMVKEARIPVLKTQVGLRSAFRTSLRGGCGVASYPRAGEARREVSALVQELRRMMRRGASQ